MLQNPCWWRWAPTHFLCCDAPLLPLFPHKRCSLCPQRTLHSTSSHCPPLVCSPQTPQDYPRCPAPHASHPLQHVQQRVPRPVPHGDVRQHPQELLLVPLRLSLQGHLRVSRVQGHLQGAAAQENNREYAATPCK